MPITRNVNELGIIWIQILDDSTSPKSSGPKERLRCLIRSIGRSEQLLRLALNPNLAEKRRADPEPAPIRRDDDDWNEAEAIKGVVEHGVTYRLSVCVGDKTLSALQST